MNIMVTGGYGFIGSNFIRYWHQNHPDDFIVNVDKLTYAAVTASLADIDSNYAFEKADICDFDDINRIVNDYSIDVIVNFAAESHNSYSITNPTIFYKTNMMGTQTLMEITRLNKNIKRLHHISTCEVYGDMALDSKEAFTQESPLKGNSPYNSAKACANLAANAYSRTYGIPITISICSNNYGPYQFPEKLIPLFITNLIQDKPITLYKESQNKREWLHVMDHCRAIDAILSAGRIGETYHIGSGIEKSVENIAATILRYFGKSDECKVYVPSRPSHDRRYLLDTTKIKNELGWEAQIPFENGMDETIRWYVENENWWRPLLDRRPEKEDQWGKLK
jgi:dTDP-glucose 4,6-dehydratase